MSFVAQQPAAGKPTTIRRLLQVFTLVRYRFFLFAGLLPYLLGAAWAFGMAGVFDAAAFWSGLGGVAFAVLGVEAFNEFFDSRMGTERVFNPVDQPPVSDAVLWLGVAAFAAALGVGGYLTLHEGWPVLAFAALGGAAAIFYEAPPIRWSYRGLGETVIALSYGPAMVLGSLYLQTRSLSPAAFWASLVPGLMIMSLAVANAIPDFHQDLLVGKRNLVVRLGRQRAVWLYLALAAAGLVAAAVGTAVGEFPSPCWAALLGLPLLLQSTRRALGTYESARRFSPAIASILACYVLAVTLFSAGLLLHGWR
ncbi:MAG TPA: prenyltransferase [Steroidobacteraceae bacterium]|nr:prenyltransferase [Steroidobacteraceae bacterium]